MNLKRRRNATVIKFGNSEGITLTEELDLLNIKNGDEVLVSVIDNKIEIEKVKK